MSDRIAEIRARLAAATPGPWITVLGSGNNVCTAVAHDTPDGGIVYIADCLPEYALASNSAPDDHRPNLRFIQHAPADIAWLLAELERIAGGTP